MSLQKDENLSLPVLQNLLKRDPGSYKDDFIKMHEEFGQRLKDFSFSTNVYDERLESLVVFLSQVIHCYPDFLKQFADMVINTLREKALTMDPTMRMAFIKAVILMKNKSLLQGSSVIELFFELFKCQDKLLRKTLRIFIIHDIKRVNLKHKSVKLNTTLQNFMATMVNDSNTATAKEAVLIMVDLFKRNIWRDARTVNVLVNSCYSKNTKVLVSGLQFFLGKHDKEPNESDSESEPEDEKQKKMRQAKLGHRVGRKTKKRTRRLDRALSNLKRVRNKKSRAGSNEVNLPAIQLVHDPQNFAERLFKKVESTRERFEVRLMMLDLISRIIGIHQLLVLNYYPFLQRYLTPHQKDVTHMLLYAAQASHDLIPPDVVEPLTRTIANNFITERASSEAIAVGLNSVREICARCPYAVGEDLLSDLVEYRTYRDKNVVAASRSLIRLFRQLNPALLPKKERGRPMEGQELLDVAEGVGVIPARQFGGCSAAPGFVPGAEVLKDTSELDAITKEQANWESCSEDENNSDDEWVDVDHSSDDAEKAESDQKTVSLTPAERAHRAEFISTTRILTQEDFEKIRQQQKTNMSQAIRGSKSRKREADRIDVDETALESEKNGDMATLSDITRLVKRAHQSKEERLDTVKEGREDREKYGFKVMRQNPNASTTNREKRKMKPFMMVKHKMKTKVKKSFREKQMNLRDRLKKMAKFKHS